MLAIMKIIYVEDNVLNLRLVQKMLRQDHNIAGAQSGAAAFEQIESDPPDLILLDINLPDMDGYAILEHLRNGSHRHIPVIAVTANAMIGDRERILGAGFDEYIAKPLSRKELEQAIISIGNVYPGRV